MPTPSVDPLARRVLAAAVAVSVVAVVYGLATRSYWLDEGFTVTHASLGWDRFAELLTTIEANGALHSLLEFGLVRVSTEEWWTRLPSAVAFVGTVPLTYLLVRRLFDQRVAALAALLVSLNAFALEYGQQARTYGMYLAAATLSTWLFVRHVQEGRRATWWAWVASMAVLGYLHFFGVLIVAAQAAVSLVLRPADRRVDARNLVAGFLAAAAAAVPLLLFLLVYGREEQATDIPALTPVRFVGVFVRLAGGIPLTVLAGGAAALALWKLRPDRALGRSMPTPQWGVVLLVAVLLVPVVVVAVTSSVVSLFGARYFVTGVPAIAGLAAVGVASVTGERARVALASLLVIGGVAGVLLWHTADPVEDVRAAANDVVDARTGSDEAIVFVPFFTYLPFNAYTDELPALAQLELAWPRAEWGELPQEHPDELPDGELGREGEAARIAEHDVVWIVQRGNLSDEDRGDLVALDDALGLDHRLTAERTYPGLVVRRFERP